MPARILVAILLLFFFFFFFFCTRIRYRCRFIKPLLIGRAAIVMLTYLLVPTTRTYLCMYSYHIFCLLSTFVGNEQVSYHFIGSSESHGFEEPQSIRQRRHQSS